MNKFKRTSTLLALVMISTLIFSQETAPSLQIGLNGLVGSKGTIDIDVLSEIIVGKQEELKKEGIKVIIRNSANNGSYAFYSYLNQSLNNLFENKTAIATERKLLENSTNLAMVYGFAEFYLRTSYTLMQNGPLRDVLEHCNSSLIDVDVQKFWLDRLVKVPSGIATTGVSISSLSTRLKDTANPISYDELVRNYYSLITNNLRDIRLQVDKKFEEEHANLMQKNHNLFSISNFKVNQLKPSDYSKSNQPLSEILVDMMYDIMLRNEQLEKLGFFKVTREINDEKYTQLNKYLNTVNPTNRPQLCEDLGMSLAQVIQLQEKLQSLHDRLELEIGLLLESHQMVKELMRKSMSISQLVSHYGGRRGEITSYAVFEDKLSRIIDTILTHTSKLSDSLVSPISESVRFLKSLALRDNDLFTDEDIRTFLNEGYKMKTLLQFKNILKIEDERTFDKVYAYVWHKRLLGLEQKLSSNNLLYLSQINLTTFSDFMSLLSNIGELDKADSYTEIFKLIMNAGYMYDNFANTRYFNQLVGTIEKYTTVNVEKKFIELDVESIILSLYERWGKQPDKNFVFYFSIGLNQSMWGKTDTTNEVDANSFAFVSEKIGVRYKIMNFEKRRNLQSLAKPWYYSQKCWNKQLLGEEKSKNPIVKNINLSAYGSGLLYNITNSTTKKDFKSPMLGLSAGMQFFNGLEFNFFANAPLFKQNNFYQNMTRNQYVGIAFDVPIADYLNGIKKKREEEKRQKEAEKSEASAEK